MNAEEKRQQEKDYTYSATQEYEKKEKIRACFIRD